MRWRTHETHHPVEYREDAIIHPEVSSAFPHAVETCTEVARNEVQTSACPQQEPVAALCKSPAGASVPSRQTEAAALPANTGGDEVPTIPMPESVPASADKVPNPAGNGAEPDSQCYDHAEILQHLAPDSSMAQLPIHDTRRMDMPGHSTPSPPAILQVLQAGVADPASGAPLQGHLNSQRGTGTCQAHSCAPGHAEAAGCLVQSVGESAGNLQRNSPSLEVSSECDRNRDHPTDAGPDRNNDPTHICLKSDGMRLAAGSEMKDCVAQEPLQTDTSQLVVASAPECTVSNTTEENCSRPIVHGNVRSVSNEIDGTLPDMQPAPLIVAESPAMNPCATAWPPRSGCVGPTASEIGHGIIELEKRCTMGDKDDNHVDHQIQGKEEDMQNGVASGISVAMILCYIVVSKRMRTTRCSS